MRYRLSSPLTSSYAFSPSIYLFFLFTATPTPDFSPLSLHDALPISFHAGVIHHHLRRPVLPLPSSEPKNRPPKDRKSTRLNSSHGSISYAVFCLKKKKKKIHKRSNNCHKYIDTDT